MAVTYETKTWKDDKIGDTPIVADELNRIEKGISDTVVAVNDLDDTVSNQIAPHFYTDTTGTACISDDNGKAATFTQEGITLADNTTVTTSGITTDTLNAETVSAKDFTVSGTFDATNLSAETITGDTVAATTATADTATVTNLTATTATADTLSAATITATKAISAPNVPKFFFGTVTCTPNGTSVRIWTAAQFRSLFGRVYHSAGVNWVAFTNGDINAQIPFTAAAFARNGDVYAAFSRTVTGQCRLNYMVVMMPA